MPFPFSRSPFWCWFRLRSVLGLAPRSSEAGWPSFTFGTSSTNLQPRWSPQPTSLGGWAELYFLHQHLLKEIANAFLSKCWWVANSPWQLLIRTFWRVTITNYHHCNCLALLSHSLKSTLIIILTIACWQAWEISFRAHRLFSHCHKRGSDKSQANGNVSC